MEILTGSPGMFFGYLMVVSTPRRDELQLPPVKSSIHSGCSEKGSVLIQRIPRLHMLFTSTIPSRH